MADGNFTLQNDFTIKISKTLADEFISREVFPELRLLKAYRVMGPSYFFTISIVLADEI